MIPCHDARRRQRTGRSVTAARGRRPVVRHGAAGSMAGRFPRAAPVSRGLMCRREERRLAMRAGRGRCRAAGNNSSKFNALSLTLPAICAILRLKWRAGDANRNPARHDQCGAVSRRAACASDPGSAARDRARCAGSALGRGVPLDWKARGSICGRRSMRQRPSISRTTSPVPARRLPGALDALLDPVVARAVDACRAAHDMALDAAEAQQMLHQAQTSGHCWAEPLQQRAEALTLKAATLLIEAHARVEEAEGVARAVGLARRGETWTPRDLQAEAEALFGLVRQAG